MRRTVFRLQSKILAARVIVQLGLGSSDITVSGRAPGPRGAVALDRPIPMGERTTFYFDTGQGGVLMPGYSFHYTYIRDAIPAVSEWGLVVMTLLVLTAGTVVFGRRRAAA